MTEHLDIDEDKLIAEAREANAIFDTDDGRVIVRMEWLVEHYPTVALIMLKQAIGEK